MFYEVANSPFGFWIVALVIAIIDSAILLKGGEFLFTVGSDGVLRIRIPKSPFLLRNRELVLTSISFFQSPFYLSSVSASISDSPNVQTKFSTLAAESRSLSFFSGVCLLIIVVGAVASVIWGISVALLPALVGLYANSISATVFLCMQKKMFRLTNTLCLRVALELLLCPFLAMNLFKKVSFRKEASINVWQIATEPLIVESIESNIAQFDPPPILARPNADA